MLSSWNSHALLVGMENGVTTLENICQCFEVKPTPNLLPSQFTPNYLPERNKNLCPHKDLHTDVHNNIICDRQKREMALTFINRETGKQIVEYHTGILLGYRKNELLIHAIIYTDRKQITSCLGLGVDYKGH